MNAHGLNAFISRRGTPSYIVSDTGNFVAGERELEEFVEKLDKENIVQNSPRFENIEWDFNLSSGPHFGGVFEAMIKSAKKPSTVS